MRMPALMMTVVMVAIFGAGCAKFRPKPRTVPAPQPPRIEEPTQTPKSTENENNLDEINKQNRERLKIKSRINDRLDSLEKKLHKKEEELATRRAQGLDTAKAEDILKKSKNLWEEAEKLYLEANVTEDYEPANGLLNAIESSFKQIDQEAKKAPRFREKSRPQRREHADDRDFVIERMGRPDREREGPNSTFRIRIMDPTPILTGSLCFDSMTNDIVFQWVPRIKIFEYNREPVGKISVVFWEHNTQFDTFVLRSSLSPHERDAALARLCMELGGSDHFKILSSYTNRDVGMPEFFLEQILSGRGQFIDQVGLGALPGVKAAGALSDLELVSVVFNTAIGPINIEQHDLWKKINDQILDQSGQVEFDPRAGVLIYDQERADKIKQALAKVGSWQATLLPKKNDKKQLLNLAVKNKEDLAKLLDDFEAAITKLAKEFGQVQKQLLRFKKDYSTELVFYDDESPIIIMLMQGVGFKLDDQSAQTLFKRDAPRIKIESKLSYYRSKNDTDPQVIKEGLTIITETNRYIDLNKDLQRLTSFMLGWPSGKPLTKGYYKLKFNITDEIREKAIIYEFDFTVLPADFKLMR